MGSPSPATATCTSRPTPPAASFARFLLVAGAGTLDRVEIEGDGFKAAPIRGGFRTLTSVTRVGSTAWVSEGKCAERSRLPLVDSIGWTECFYLPGYYSSSSSQFTSGGAENPTLTIVALAIRQAEYLADQLSKKEM